MPELNSGDTAWILASSALVLLMTPGLAFFYGGMVRVKSVLNMLMMSAAAMAITTVIWVMYGYSLALTTDVGSGLLGSRDAFGLADQILDTKLIGTVPETVFIAFQLMFAIITVALISGAVADRAKFSTWCVFVAFWVTLVYIPVAHWVFFFDGGNGGWIADRLKALDFAGGTAVHINAGAAALALVIVLGKRKGWRKDPMRPHSMPLVFLGTGLLWFGWFGFNSGSALGREQHRRCHLHQHPGGHRGGDHRLDARRAPARRSLHHPGRRLRRGRRPRGHHPRLQHREPDGRDGHRRHHRRRLRPGDLAEVQARLRRLARRRRRPPRRRPVRHRPDRPVRYGVRPRGCRRALLRRRR